MRTKPLDFYQTLVPICLPEDFLNSVVLKASRRLGLLFLVVLTLILLPVGLNAQDNDLIKLDSNETLFTVLAGINNCGFDAELASSDPLRVAIRGEIGHNIELSDAAKNAADGLCSFYRDHQQPDAVRTLSQYVSLALYLNPPPAMLSLIHI